MKVQKTYFAVWVKATKRLSCFILFGFLINKQAVAQNFWQQTNGPYGGNVSALAINSKGEVFAGFAIGVDRGVYRSTDNGASWRQVNSGLTNTNILSMAVNPNTNFRDHLFVGTYQGIYRSTDSSANWIAVNQGITFINVFALAVNAKGYVFAGTEPGRIFRSKDNAVSWEEVRGFGSIVNTLAVNPFNDHVFAGTLNGGIEKSVDDGGTWVKVNNGLENQNITSFAFNSTTELFAGTAPGAPSVSGIYRSTNGGNSWTIVKANESVNTLAINKSGNIFAGTYNGIFRSTDQGNSWLGISFGLMNTKIRTFAFNSFGHIFAGTGGNGVYLSTTNGNSWSPAVIGLPNIEVNVLAIAPNGNIFAGAKNDGGVFRSNDRGGKWGSVNTGFSTNLSLSVLDLIANQQGHIFAGISGGAQDGVFRSDNNGDNWTQKVASLSGKFAINANGDIFVTDYPNGVYRSINNGENWSPVNTGLTSRYVVDLAINLNGTIFAGTVLGGVFRSTNNGGNWLSVNNGLSSLNVSKLAINSMNEVFALSDQGIFRSNNTGDQWMLTNSGLTDAEVQTLFINNLDYIFIGTKTKGVLLSKDNGKTWTEVNTGLANLDVETLEIDQSGFLFAGTQKGVFSTVQTTTKDLPFANTNPASNITTTTAALNGDVNPNGDAINVYFEWGTTINYGNTTSMQAISASAKYTSVNANLTNLTPNTRYHYRIVAVNGLGRTNGQNQIFNTKIEAPSLTTNGATTVDTSTATFNGTVNPRGDRTIVKFQYGLTENYDKEIIATQSPLIGTTTLIVSAKVSGLSPHTQYHFRVVATNSGGTANGSDKTFRTYRSNLAWSTLLPFKNKEKPSDYQPSEYRLVGLPGASNLAISTVLAGTAGKNWQAYWDNGTASNDPKQYLAKFDGTSIFEFSVGRAFWIIHKGDLAIARTVLSAPLTSGAVIIPLHVGWNIIANPFADTLDWGKVQAVNNISQPIWSYNGAFSISSKFKSYEGYYFDNSELKLTSLRIPYDLIFSTNALLENNVPGNWRINISLSAQTILDNATAFGIVENARIGRDNFDYRKPRSVEVIPFIAFNRKEWDTHYSTFATDIRPEFDDKESWDFEVQSAQREELKLTFSGIERVPSQFEVYLIDEGRSRYVSLREDSLYSFTPPADISKFTVLVGKAEAIKEQLETIPPKELSLGQNYPNPFNPLTAIPVSIPVTTEIKLKVYDFLGKEVKTLYAGSLELGQHFFHWDGRDERGNTLATGVYFYRLTTKAHGALVGKMILMR